MVSPYSLGSYVLRSGALLLVLQRVLQDLLMSNRETGDGRIEVVARFGLLFRVPVIAKRFVPADARTARQVGVQPMEFVNLCCRGEFSKVKAQTWIFRMCLCR